MKTTERKSRNFQSALVSLKGRLSAISQYGSDSSAEIAEWAKLKERFRLTQRQWEYLRGYRHAVTDAWHRDGLLEFRYATPDGTFVAANWSEMSDEQREFVMKSKDPLGGHFWKHNGRPWFVSGSTANT